MEYKRIYVVMFVIFLISIFSGVTFSFWQWQSTENTVVVFDVKSGESCALVDGGGNITSSEIVLAPASCTNSKFAIKREINITPVITEGSSTSLDLWLDINDLGTGLSNSQNFKYVLTTSDSSCTDDVVASGNFNGKSVGDTVPLLNEKSYTRETVDTYYLYVWLDSAETSSSTMYQSFNLSIGGTCSYQMLDFNVTLVAGGGNISGGKTLTNMVTNGSFEQQSTGWTLSNASVTSNQKYTGNYALQLNANVTAMSMQPMSVTSPTLNHKYYGRTMFLSSSSFTNSDNRFEWYYTDNLNGTLIFSRKSDQTSEWITKSNILSLSESSYLLNSWKIRNFIVNGSTVSYVDDVMIIDLTNSYGLGNELTDYSVLDQIPYFEGTESIYNMTITYGTSYGTLPVPTRTGYTFMGWYDAPSGGTKVTSDTIMNKTENHILYAQWNINSYSFNLNILNPDGSEPCQTGEAGTVQMSVNDGTYSTVYNEPSSSYSYGTVLKFRNFSPGTGRYLSGVSGANESGGVWMVTLTGDVTVEFNTAWNVYTVSYNANGGSGAPGNQTKTYGSDLTLSTTVPTRNGYTFLGWSTSSTATSATYQAGGIYNSNATVTLYAVWKKNSINPISSYSCANGSAGSEPYALTYTGNCTVIDDGNDNWRVKFLTDGSLTIASNTMVDVFLVGGGGGGGWYQAGCSGGGGYTQTGFASVKENTVYNIDIGDGGASGQNGSDTFAFGGVAFGGNLGGNNNDCTAGSGGSGGGRGSDGSDGAATGQGTTTREFGETNATLYADGGGSSGGGGGTSGNVSGGENTGGGAYRGGTGGSGIVVIRNTRINYEDVSSLPGVAFDFTYTGSYIVENEGSGNWKIKFLTDGEFSVNKNMSLDVFLVGEGGSGGWYQAGCPGGGGYTKTNSVNINSGSSYNIDIGDDYDGGNGAETVAFDITVEGGGAGGSNNDCTAGSGGSGGGGGSDGSNGAATGQGTTTREFGEPTGKLYAGGGGGTLGGSGGGGGRGHSSGIKGSGGGGGVGGAGGSGIVIIRNKR